MPLTPALRAAMDALVEDSRLRILVMLPEHGMSSEEAITRLKTEVQRRGLQLDVELERSPRELFVVGPSGFLPRLPNITVAKPGELISTARIDRIFADREAPLSRSRWSYRPLTQKGFEAQGGKFVVVVDGEISAVTHRHEEEVG